MRLTAAQKFESLVQRWRGIRREESDFDVLANFAEAVLHSPTRITQVLLTHRNSSVLWLCASNAAGEPDGHCLCGGGVEVEQNLTVRGIAG